MRVVSISSCMKFAVAVAFRDRKTHYVEVPQVFLYLRKNIGGVFFRRVVVLSAGLLGQAAHPGLCSPI